MANSIGDHVERTDDDKRFWNVRVGPTLRLNLVYFFKPSKKQSNWRPFIPNRVDRDRWPAIRLKSVAEGSTTIVISLLTTLKISCIVAFSGAAAVCDYRYRRLPNVLTVTALCCGFVFQIVQGATQSSWLGGWQGFVLALQGFATGFGLLLAIWLIGGGGAGDAKRVGLL